jgi:peroxiredoxin
MTELEAEGITLVAVSYDSVEVLAQFAESHETSFPLLSDPESAAIKSYRIYKDGGDGIPHPTVFLIDSQNAIVGKLRYEGYKTRHNSADIITAARSLKAPRSAH